MPSSLNGWSNMGTGFRTTVDYARAIAIRISKAWHDIKILLEREMSKYGDEVGENSLFTLRVLRMRT